MILRVVKEVVKALLKVMENLERTLGGGREVVGWRDSGQVLQCLDQHSFLSPSRQGVFV